MHRGGAALPSLLAVAENHGLDDAMVTYLLQALVDKSIVFASFPEGEVRYDLLDTVREYALAQLEQSGGLPAARRRTRSTSRRWPTARAPAYAGRSGRHG